MVFFLLFVVASCVVSVMGDCRLDPHPSVEYRCKVPGVDGGTRACEGNEPAGTIVTPQCRKPNYYTSSPLAYMHCFESGRWDYVARCLPECGRITPDGMGLVIGGRTVKRGELPWHAGIYTKTTKPYKQICGGSLVSTNVVLSAAHCFWNDLEKQLPASDFAVAVGKLFRPWNDNVDQAQKSNVKTIHLPRRYQGAGANYQDDIAVVIVAKEFRYETFIRPVCLSFDYLFESQQLFPGVIGKVAGWGLTSANGNASSTLQVVDLPYVDVGTCIKNSRPDYREFITSDKICAGTLKPDTALCEGDSGGGLVFLESIRGVQRYYLRGLVSTAPTSYNNDKCNNDTYTSFTSILKHEHFIKQFWIEQGEFKCRDGGYISVANYCDGTKDCADGSDETVSACSKNSCSSYLFRCAYGACVDKGATCNGVPDCADGSDETDKQCTTGPRPALPLAVPKEGACILPPFPAHGAYESNIAGAKPGQGYEQVILTNVTCQPGYGVLGPISDQIYCFNGHWTEEVPKCVRMCTLEPSPSVEYMCLDFVRGNRVCKTHEQNGTLVKPQCRRPNFYSKKNLPYMQCLDGEWDNIPQCTPECGRVVPAAMPLVAGGKPAYRGEVPWFAGIYTKTKTPTHICGGSLLRHDIVLTAAHCFHNDKKLLPASMFAVAVGKLFRSWDAEEDGQKSDAKTILVPPRYSGAATNYQDDIAMVIVTSPFEYKTSVRPACLDFDVNFERRQLQDGNKGMVAGWGLTHEGGTPSQVLQVTELPYVEVGKCIAGFPPSYLAFTTSDKICAGFLEPGSALCKGDTGGGLVFPEDRNGIRRYYIRGIVSLAPKVSCDEGTYTSFTQIQKHEDFFKRFMRDI